MNVYQCLWRSVVNSSQQKRREKKWREKYKTHLLVTRAPNAKSKTVILEIHQGPVIVASQIFDKSHPLGGVDGQRKHQFVLLYRFFKIQYGWQSSAFGRQTNIGPTVASRRFLAFCPLAAILNFWSGRKSLGIIIINLFCTRVNSLCSRSKNVRKMSNTHKKNNSGKLS